MLPADEDISVQMGAGLDKLEKEIEALDSTVERYEKALHEYQDSDIPVEELETNVEAVVDDFCNVFNSMDWLGETTGSIVGGEPEESYEKFPAYRGLVFAAHHTGENVNEISVTCSMDGPVQREQEEIVDTWNEFKDVYGKALEVEDTARDISVEEGREQEGLDPYAFETPFQVLEEKYDRISDLKECVNGSYR
jgi:hypothetical protein